MRTLGPTLVVLALVFSTGGVAIVGHAGSPEAAQAEQGAAPVAPNACETPAEFRPAPVKAQVLKDVPNNKTIVLNTSGYNFVLDGEWRPAPVGEPQDVPEGVLPDDTDSAPPTAPAKK